MISSIDSAVLGFINQFSRQWESFDKLVNLLSRNGLLKGGVVVAILWWCLFSAGGRNHHNQRQAIAVLFASVLAMVAARALALTLPFHPRPIHNPSLSFVHPVGLDPGILDGWSSCPSDHAALFLSLSAGIFFMSRRAGLIAFAYTLVFICLPRIYLGLHYPSDILCGAVVGIVSAIPANKYLMKNPWFESFSNKLLFRPELFYSGLFLFSYQIADTFESSRSIVEAGVRLVHSFAN